MALLGGGKFTHTDFADTFLYASKVKKTNMFEWTQERTLVITNNALYNIHKKSIKRMIRISDI